jgi:hypothetical protein
MTKRFLTPISTPFVDFNTDQEVTSAVGRLFWNSEEGTLDLGMENEVIQSIGMEFYMPPTKNDSGEEIPNGSFVMATGAQGDRITIAKAVTDGSVDPMFMIGVATETIEVGSESGLITTNGIVRDVDTSDWIVGTILYPNSASPGTLTSVTPQAPNIKTPIAIVLRQQENTGRIYVRMTNGSVLGGTDSNVTISNPTDGQVLTYDSSSGIWRNEDSAAAQASQRDWNLYWQPSW